MLYYVNSKFFSLISTGDIKHFGGIGPSCDELGALLAIEAGELVVLLEKDLKQRVIKFLSCRGIGITSVSIFKRYCTRLKTF